jgi:hypothetical protein
MMPIKISLIMICLLGSFFWFRPMFSSSTFVGDSIQTTKASNNAQMRGFTHTIENGFDWSFPYHVTPKSNSGAFYMNTLGESEDIQLIGVTLFWSLLNPADNVYDFTMLDQIISLAEEHNVKIVLRLKCSVVDRYTGGSDADQYLPYIPQWVLDKHKPTIFYTLLKPPTFIQVAAPWNEGVQKELQKFISVFGKKNFLSHDRLAGLYVHGISSSAGEEFWLDRRYTQYALEAGMTEEKLMRAFENRITWWAEAAGENVHKLAWIHFGNIQLQNYDPDRLNNFAIKKGLGYREGGIEYYNAWINKYLGQTVDKEGHIHTDWNHPFRDGKRFFGEEAEVIFPEYPKNTQIHCFESSIMRLAQLGMNYVWVSEPAVSLSPAMVRWWTKIAGKNQKSSPEAVCWLREDYIDYSYRKTTTLRNFEHFLVQRDQKGFYTDPVEKTKRYVFYMDPLNIDYDYAARSTNVKRKDTGMLFYIDPVFRENMGTQFYIKVMYLDSNKCKWVLSHGTHWKQAVSATIKGTADNQWKTATFNITQFVGEQEPFASDFSLQVLNNEDLTVKFVRVIKSPPNFD